MSSIINLRKPREWEGIKYMEDVDMASMTNYLKMAILLKKTLHRRVFEFNPENRNMTDIAGALCDFHGDLHAYYLGVDL